MTKWEASKARVAALLLALLCGATAPAHALPPRYAWIKQHMSTNEVARDERFAALLHAATPWFIADPSHARWQWATLEAQFATALGGPPDDVVVTDDRYVVLSACWPHNCGAKGMLWFDTATGASVGAVFDTNAASIDPTPGRFRPGSLLVFSKSSACRALPAAFHDALAAWVSATGITVEVRSFVGRSGQREPDCP